MMKPTKSAEQLAREQVDLANSNTQWLGYSVMQYELSSSYKRKCDNCDLIAASTCSFSNQHDYFQSVLLCQGHKNRCKEIQKHALTIQLINRRLINIGHLFNSQHNIKHGYCRVCDTYLHQSQAYYHPDQLKFICTACKHSSHRLKRTMMLLMLSAIPTLIRDVRVHIVSLVPLC